MHGQGTGKDTGTGIGNLQQFKQTLYATIFAVASVQGDKGRFDPFVLQYFCHVTSDIDSYGIISTGNKRQVNGRTALKGYLPFSGKSTKEHADFF